MRHEKWSGALLACGYLAAVPAWADTRSPTAVFDFGFDDTSLEGQEHGTQADQQKRLQALGIQLREQLAQSGCCTIVNLASIEPQLKTIDVWKCNGCDVDLARKTGAKISVIGWVQKVSNLILNINIVARSVATNKIIGAGSVDIRGNTDESWSRGLTYLLRNRLHPSTW